MSRMSKVPIVDYLVIDEGDPHLVGQRCGSCSATFFDRRNACAKCGKAEFGATSLATLGTLLTYTVVHRAAPKVKAPYVSCVVELDGGGTIKSNLHGTSPDPNAIQLGCRVRLLTFVAGVDDDGTEAIGFGFEPITEKDEK
jgi:uncharacterized OB-fold protein